MHIIFTVDFMQELFYLSESMNIIASLYQISVGSNLYSWLPFVLCYTKVLIPWRLCSFAIQLRGQDVAFKSICS